MLLYLPIANLLFLTNSYKGNYLLTLSYWLTILTDNVSLCGVLSGDFSCLTGYKITGPVSGLKKLTPKEGGAVYLVNIFKELDFTSPQSSSCSDVWSFFFYVFAVILVCCLWYVWEHVPLRKSFVRDERFSHKMWKNRQTQPWMFSFHSGTNNPFCIKSVAGCLR